MPKRSFTDVLYKLFQAGRFYYRREFLGAALVVVGLWLLWGVLLPAASVHWLTLLVGWTAPLVATAILLLGGVLWLGRQAGYWSAEALLGAEALLFGLITFSYVRNHDAVNWYAYFDAAGGGLVGWGLGNLLIGALGAPLAVLLAVGVSLVGAALLVRYTPLIYVAAAVIRGAPGLYRWLAGWLAGERQVADQPPPQTPNFVAARPPVEAPAVPVPAAQPNQPRQQPPPPPAKAPKKSAASRAPRPAGHLPPLDLLRTDTAPSGNRDVTALQQLIVETLEDFNVPVRVVHVESGPTVTQFGVEPLYVESAGQKRKVRVSRIVSLADDLALALAAPAVRIEAPVPGRSYVGVEVPNLDKTLVTLRGILEETDLNKAGILALPLGRNTEGATVTMDLTRAPHMLIAGATGSGKSVCINTLVAGLLMQHGPENLRFVMVDPKMVELPGYNGIPHLYGKVITATDQVMGALTWLLIQMDDRYQLFRDLGVRNIDSYNEAMRAQKGGQTLPYILL
ncbi:MAG: DNA translocase FtsK, partial [Caldilinea sp.]